MILDKTTTYYFGLPIWTHSEWRDCVYGGDVTSKNTLQKYAAIFNTVEGNTTFYATPSRSTVASWLEQVHSDFRFCFKLPKTITHTYGLRDAKKLLTDFLTSMEPLAEHLGPLMIQLPATFSPQQLNDLEQFLDTLPADFDFSVEVRHPSFFNKSDEEKSLNQLLNQHSIDRVCFDSRALFSRPAINEAERHAQGKKPNLPVHALSTGQYPIIRFVGSSDSKHTEAYWQPWIQKLKSWVEQGKSPYVFIHSPNNAFAPQLAQTLNGQLEAQLPGWQALNLSDANNNQLAIF